MKFILKLLIILFLFTVPSAFSTVPDNCKSVAFKNTLPKSKKVTDVICYTRFTVGFYRDSKTALWTAEKLTKEQDSLPNVKRTNKFRPDPNIPSVFQSSQRAFEGTAFDRGHLTNFDNLGDDAKSADETFYMTNIVPQYSIHNRGIWKTLENRTRKLASVKGEIFILTGPIFDSAPKTLTDGTYIPSSFFKVIVIPGTKQIITFIIPNSNNIKSSDLDKFIVKMADLKKTNKHISSFVYGRIKLTELTEFPEI